VGHKSEKEEDTSVTQLGVTGLNHTIIITQAAIAMIGPVTPRLISVFGRADRENIKRSDDRENDIYLYFFRLSLAASCRTEIRVPAGEGNVLPCQNVQTGSGAHPAPMCTRTLSPGGGVDLTINLSLVARLRIRGAIPPLPTCEAQPS
jgi:hypothetical protein